MRQNAILNKPNSEKADWIRVRGARVHNLRDLDVDIPRDRLVVLTGVSGSGKSTLAFDVLHAEGRRRFIEGLSADARLFLERAERPDADAIDGLPPTVAVDQNPGAANPRSTVGTLTEIHDHLRVLFARVGRRHCPRCGRAVGRQSPEQMAQTALALGEGRKVVVLAPLARGRKGRNEEAFEAIRRAGLLRARVDGETIELGDEPPRLAENKAHDVEGVVDRLVIREGIRPRLTESLDQAIKLGGGAVILSAQEENGWIDQALSVHLACLDCDVGFEELDPRSFSFNSPRGACPTCQGLGSLSIFDRDLLIPDRSRSLAQGAFAPWNSLSDRRRAAKLADPGLLAFLKRRKATVKTPLEKWSAANVDRLLDGEAERGFPGLIADLERKPAHRGAAGIVSLDDFRAEIVCPECAGARLRSEARVVTVGGKTIKEWSDSPIDDLARFVDELEIPSPWRLAAEPALREVRRRLEFAGRVGLGYLSLSRRSDTLSGGELQRVRLAAGIGAGLVGVVYILDEPTAGLHPDDTERLLRSLTPLREQGNGVIVVEHDETVMRAADWLIDLGPGSGIDGGLVVAQGPPNELVEARPGESATKRYLSHPPPTGLPDRRATVTDETPSLFVRGVTERNLKNIDVRIPIGALTCLTGVSGSGKSTLALDVLARAASRRFRRKGPRPGAFRAAEGWEYLDDAIVIDQSPIGRSPRSTPATHTGLFDEIRRVFAKTREARLRGYSPSRFAFNAKGGRCERCRGLGATTIDTGFSAELTIPCEACRGLRFDRSTLEVTFKGLSIGELLKARVDEARAIFENVPRVRNGLDALREVGLGYITLGQSAATLSGGEAQRVKLASELSKAVPDRKTLFILDEPTTGLHFADVARLVRVLRGLVDRGQTVLVIEHHLDLVRRADWVIDLGPSAGDQGGEALYQGTPEGLVSAAESRTGRHLGSARL